jgi:hypothetical protein
VAENVPQGAGRLGLNYVVTPTVRQFLGVLEHPSLPQAQLITTCAHPAENGEPALDAILKSVDGSPPPNPGIRFEAFVQARGTETFKTLGYAMAPTLCGVEIGMRFRPAAHNLAIDNPMKVFEAFVLAPHILESIEKARAGGDVPVNLGFSIMGLGSPQGVLNSGSFQAFSVGGQDPPFEIPQSRWAKICAKMGTTSTAILEIPISGGTFPASLQPVIQYVDDARSLLTEGKTDEVVTKCRKALEALNPIVSVKSDATSGPPFQRLEPSLASKLDLGSLGQSGKDPKSVRLEEIRQTLYNMLHIGPHESYQVFPEDARALLWLTSGLVRYYADLIARP